MEGIDLGQWKRSYASVGVDIECRYLFRALRIAILALLLLLLLISVADAVVGRKRLYDFYPFV